MNLIRCVSLVLLVGGQALAAGPSVAHLCRMKEAPARCHCPHEKAKADSHQAKVTSGQCCEQVVHAALEVTVTPDGCRAYGVSPAPAPAEVPPYLDPMPATDDTARLWVWAAAPPKPGPPLFLQVRSLLI